MPKPQLSSGQEELLIQTQTRLEKISLDHQKTKHSIRDADLLIQKVSL